MMQPPLLREWIKKAEDDELSARALLNDRDGAPSTVCFLAQQMAEKYLKILLEFFSQDISKTHDLKRIATLLEKKIPDVFNLDNELTLLNKYYVVTRYPGDFPEGFSWQDAAEAFGAASNIKDFALSKITSEHE